MSTREDTTGLPRLDAWLRKLNPAWPEPPQALRRGPFKARFSSPVRSVRLAAVLGITLGVLVVLCMGTGVLSHAFQAGVAFPSRPARLYQVTQGVHVAAGLALVPVVLAKLWVVYPKLWAWPPVKGPLDLVERSFLGLLVAAVLFQVVTGVMNVAGWYAFGFYFTTAHYAVAFLATGALGIHVASKATTTRTALERPMEESDE